MLADAVAAFLDSVTERGFDEPFLALLRASGFEEVAWVHGPQEFGKDFVAQKDGHQWTFQSKAGDINQSQWRELVGQLDELRLSNLSGPHFRADLPRRPVLVCTGRLTGNASLLVQEYQQRARDRNEPVLEVWHRDRLVAMLSNGPDSVLAGSVDGQLLSLLGNIDQGKLTMNAVEEFSRRWISWKPDRILGQGIVEASIACERLRIAQRLDLACQLTLCAVRGAWAAAPDVGSGVRAADAAASMFERYTRYLWQECDERLLRERGLVGYSGFSAWITYPIRCVRVAEFSALLALRVRSSDPQLFEEIARWLGQFTDAHPAAAHLISDRYAVSPIPVCLVLARSDPSRAAIYLRRATVWLCDRYERGEFGLASADASPDEEIARVLGSPFESVELQRRPVSQVAGVLLDVAALLRLRDVYADVRNDTLAVEIVPDVLLTDDTADQFSRSGFSNRWDHNPDYTDELPTEGPAAPHLGEAGSERRLVTSGRAWDLLAVSGALRDRHFPAAIRAEAATN